MDDRDGKLERDQLQQRSMEMLGGIHASDLSTLLEHKEVLIYRMRNDKPWFQVYFEGLQKDTYAQFVLGLMEGREGLNQKHTPQGVTELLRANQQRAKERALTIQNTILQHQSILDEGVDFNSMNILEEVTYIAEFREQLEYLADYIAWLKIKRKRYRMPGEDFTQTKPKADPVKRFAQEWLVGLHLLPESVSGKSRRDHLSIRARLTECHMGLTTQRSCCLCQTGLWRQINTPIEMYSF